MKNSKGADRWINHAARGASTVDYDCYTHGYCLACCYSCCYNYCCYCCCRSRLSRLRASERPLNGHASWPASNVVFTFVRLNVGFFFSFFSHACSVFAAAAGIVAAAAVSRCCSFVFPFDPPLFHTTTHSQQFPSPRTRSQLSSNNPAAMCKHIIQIVGSFPDTQIRFTATS